MSISLSLVSAHISKIRMSKVHQIFEAGCPWSWLGLPLAALRYCYAVLPVLWMTSYLSVVGQAKVTLTSRILRVAHQRPPAAKWFSKAVSFGNNSRRISLFPLIRNLISTEFRRCRHIRHIRSHYRLIIRPKPHSASLRAILTLMIYRAGCRG